MHFYLVWETTDVNEHGIILLCIQCINGVSSNPVEGRRKKLSAQRSNSNTVWFNFQTYIYIYTSENIHI